MKVKPFSQHETKSDAQPFETKAVDVEIETLSESTGEFSGMAIPFNSLHDSSAWQLDGWKDKVLPGAFTETLAAHARAGTMPLLQWMHERGNIVGTITSAKETASGVKVEGKVSPRAMSPSGVPVLELLKSGAVSGLSIGFRPTNVVLDEKSKVRSITALDWAELSIVDRPGAGPRACVTDVKSKREIEDDLRTKLGFSRQQACAFVARGYAGLSEPENDEKRSEPVKNDEKRAENAENDDVITLANDLATLIRESLSQGEPDGGQRDSAGSNADPLSDLANTIRLSV